MRKPGAFRRFIRDDKGSAVLSVVLSMIFIVALGTALLYAAYVGIKVSAVSRSDKQNFYDASAAMDEVLSGIQGEVSSALQAAYTQSLTEFAKGTSLEPQALMEQYFLIELGKVELDGEKTGTFSIAQIPLSEELGELKLDIKKLRSNYVPEGASLAIRGSKGNEELVLDHSQRPIKIEKISLSYIDDDGFESNISTDIVIEIPDFYEGSTIPQNTYSIIANGGLIVKDSPRMFSGGIYVGANGIKVGAGKNYTFKNGKIISAGPIDVEQGSTLTFDSAGYDIWTQEIIAGKNSTINLDGNCFVADDLVLNSGSKVTLKGKYYGFGSDDAATAERNDEKSSAIFVNSYEPKKAAKLDISELKQLSLAGVSFINVPGDNKVVTGQSLAAKPDQLDYLIPAAAIRNYKSNPANLRKADGSEDSNAYIMPAINTATVLWTIDGEPKTLAYYIGDSNVSDTNYVGTSGKIITYYSQASMGNDRVGYVFINFTDQAKANEYFKDFFTAKPDSIKQYLDIYLDLSKHSPAIFEITKGNTYRNTGEVAAPDWENKIGMDRFPDSQAKYYSNQYERLKKSPYEMYVNIDNINSLENDSLEFGDRSNIVAIVGGGDYTFGSNSPKKYDNLKIIVVKGDVKVNDSFTGTIIAGGTIEIKGDVTYEAFEPEDLLVKTVGGSEPLSDYINVAGFGGVQSPGTPTGNIWSIERLAYYANWQKN